MFTNLKNKLVSWGKSMLHSQRLQMALVMVAFCAAAAFAQNTAGNYEAGTTALSTVTTEIAKYVPIVVKLCYAIAGVVAVVGAISVYIAMNNEEQDVKKKIKTDYATKYATEWDNEHKEDIYSMAGSTLNTLLKGSDLALSSNASDAEKSQAVTNWGNYIGEQMKSREVDLTSVNSDGTTANTYFSMGDWSFASEQKSFYDFDFNLDRWKFGIETTDKDGEELGDKNVIVKFGFNGTISLLQKEKSNELSASVGLTLRAKVHYDFNNISDWKLRYDRTELDSLAVGGSIGGQIKIEGKMHFKKDSISDGFDGSLKMTLLGQTVTVAGGCYRMQKTAEELAASRGDQQWVTDTIVDGISQGHYEQRKTYKAVYFVASYDGGDTGLMIPGTGVSITALMGGFYYNYTVPDVDASSYDNMVKKLCESPKPVYGGYGLAAGLGLKWGADAASIDGKFALLVAFNASEGGFGTFKLLGDVNALKGTIKAKASITYSQSHMSEQNDPEREQHFNVSVTVDATADMTDQLAGFVGGKENLEKIKKTFSGGEEGHKTGLSSLTDGEQDKKKEADTAVNKESEEKEGEKKTEASEGEAKSKGDQAAKEAGGVTASAGAHISLLIDIKSRPNDPSPETGGTKWMVCVGEPELSKRCSVTLIDVAVGKGDWRIWAKVYANAYLCFGNKLPGDGLPDLPEPLKTFLDDGAVGGGGGGADVSKEGGKMAALDAQRDEAVQAIIAGGATKGKKNNGGVLFGMQAGADFGCRFGIGYVELGGLVGFDMSMKMMSEDCRCLDEKGNLKRMGGKGGAYAEGQVYAYAYGRAGLILNLGFWSGDVPLLDMSVGAVLKGGFPNPTWGYGKLKAKGALFGGLIKFNKKIEMKMGQVCMPLVGNPLDNIDIISETSIGSDEKTTGWDEENAVDCGAPFTFVTNMGIGQVLEVFDDDIYQARMGMDNRDMDKRAAQKGATRSFKFYINNYAEWGRTQWAIEQTNDNTVFEVHSGIFQEKRTYEVKLSGWCKEIFIKDDTFVEEDPFIRDMDKGITEQRPWGQEYTVYFNTQPYSDDMSKVARLVGPYDEVSTEYEILHPFVSLIYPLPQFGKEGVEIFGDLEMEVTDPITGEKHLLLPDQLYSDDGLYRRLTSTKSKYQGIHMRQVIEEGTDNDGRAYKYITVMPVNQGELNELKLAAGSTYRWTFYEMNVAGLNKLRNGVEETYEKLSAGDTSALTDLMGNEEVQNWLAESGNESMVADMLREYQDGGNEFNVNEMEGRINTISAEAYNRGSSFRTEILSWETQCAAPLNSFSGTGGKPNYTGYAPTFREQMMNDMRTTTTYERRLYSRKNPDSNPNVLTGGGMYVKPIAMRIGNDPDKLDIYTNPYHRLWWWNWKAMYQRSNTRGNALTRGWDCLYGCDYFENGEPLRMSMEGGHRLKSSEGSDSYFMFVTREDAQITFQQFTEMFNPFGSNRWVAPAKNYALSNLIAYAKGTYYDDCYMVMDLDDDILEVYNSLIRREYSAGQDERNYGTNKVNGTATSDIYLKFLRDAQSLQLESEAHGDTYVDKTLNRLVKNNLQYSSWVSYPSWQVGAMYMTSRYHLGKHSISDADFTASKYEKKSTHQQQFLHPWDFITNDYYSFSPALRDQIYDNIRGARRFTGAAPAKLEFLVMRPNRYNVAAQDYGMTGDVQSTYMPHDYQVSKSEQGDRIIYMCTDLDGNVSSVSSVLENTEIGSIVFSDPVVGGVIKKALGKDIVTYEDLQTVTEFTLPASAGQVKRFDDFYNLKNLEKFNWNAWQSIEGLSFEGNPKLREIVIENNAGVVDIDFSTCPNLRRLVIKVKNPQGEYVEYQYGQGAYYLYPTYTWLKQKPDFTKMPLLERIQINYSDLDKVDLSNCPHLQYLNLEYNMIGSKDIEVYLLKGNELPHYDKGVQNIPLYTFDLTKLKNAEVHVGHQLAQRGGVPVSLIPSYLSYTETTIDIPSNWSYDFRGRKVVARVSDPTIYMQMSEGGRWYDPSVSLITPDGTTSISQVQADLSDLDVNLRKVLFAEFGKAKTDANGKPLTSTHLPNEIEYWTDLYTIDLDKLKYKTELDASGCNIQSIQYLPFYMPYLRKLNLSDNLLTSADLTAFKSLNEVNLANNRLTRIDLSLDNQGITHFDISGNRLREFDFAKLPNLVELNCSNNSLYQVDLSKAPKLTRLDCSHNNLGDIDIRTCPLLAWLDCSYNQMRSAPNQMGVTIVVDEGSNSALTTLIASHINTEDWPMCQVQKLSSLRELNLSGNSGLQSVTVSKQIKKINVADTQVDVLYYDQPNGQYRVLYLYTGVDLKEFDAHNSHFGRSYPSRTVETPILDRIDLSETEIDVINVRGTPEIYVGQSARTGKRIAVAYNNDAGLALWDSQYKNHPKNANTYGFKGSVNSTDVQTALAQDVVDENMVRLRKALGTELYDHIKGDSTLAAIPEAVLSSTRVIDARPYNVRVTDLKFVVGEFPKLEALYLSQDMLEGNEYRVSKSINKVVIVNPYSQLSPETMLQLHGNPTTVDGSLLCVNGYTLKGNWSYWGGKFETVDFSNCEFTDADELFTPGTKYTRRFTADNTNIRQIRLWSGNKLKKLSLRNCKDLETIYVEDLGRYDSADSLMLDGCNPDLTIVFESSDQVRRWMGYFANRYPDVKLALRATCYDGKDIIVPLNDFGPKYILSAVDVIYEKAKKITASAYESRPAISEADQAILKKLLPNSRVYFNVWKALAKYPDGVRLSEIKSASSLDLTGAQYTDGKVLKDNDLKFRYLTALDSAFVCDTYYATGRESRIALYANLPIENVVLPANWHGEKVDISRTGVNSQTIETVVAQADTVFANNLREGVVLNVTVPADANCKVLRLKRDYVETITLNKTLDQFSAIDPTSDHMVIYINAPLPVFATNFGITNSDKVTVRTKRDDVVRKWFSTYASVYPNVVFEVVFGTDVYVPVSSYSNYSYTATRYADLYANFPDGWTDLEVIDLNGKKVSEKALDQLLIEAPNATTLITGSGLNTKRPVISVPEGSKMRVFDLRGYPTIETIQVLGHLVDGSEIILDGNTNLMYTNNIFKQAETVSVAGCPKVAGTITVNAEDPARIIDLSGTAVSEIVLERPITSLKAKNMVGDTLGIRFTGSLDGVALDLDKTKLRSVHLDADGVPGWFGKYASTYPSTKVYLYFNGTDMLVTSVDDYESKIEGVVGKYLKVLKKNMPEVNGSNYAEVTTLNIRGAGADDDFFKFMAEYMPKVDVIIADAPGSLKGNEGGIVTIPVLQTPLKEMRIDGCTGINGIRFGDWGGDFVSADNAEISMSNVNMEDYPTGVSYAFRTVKAHDSKITGLGIFWDHKVTDIDLTGSAVAEVNISKEMERVILKNQTSPSLSIYTEWLPEDPAKFDVSGNKEVTIQFFNPECIPMWFERYAPVYPGVKIVANMVGYDIIVTSAEEYALLPLLEKNPGVTLANLAQQETINLNNCVDINELLPIVYERCPKLKKLNMADNYSWQPTYTYDHYIDVDFGDLGSPKTLIIVANPRANKFTIGNDHKLTVKFASLDAVSAWGRNGCASKFANCKYSVDVNGHEFVTSSLDLVYVLTRNANSLSSLTKLDISGYGVPAEELTALLEILPAVTTIDASNGGVTGKELTIPATNHAYVKINLSGNSQLTTVNMEGLADSQTSELNLLDTHVNNLGPLAQNFHKVYTKIGFTGTNNPFIIEDGEIKFDNRIYLTKWFEFVTDITGITTYYKIYDEYVEVTSYDDAKQKEELADAARNAENSLDNGSGGRTYNSGSSFFNSLRR